MRPARCCSQWPLLWPGCKSGSGPSQQAAGIRGRAPRWSAPLGFAMLSGATQAVADVLVVIGIHRGDLAIMAALMALYPLGTIALARVIMGERLTALQVAGIVLAVAASAALSAS